eukprot:m.100611 g.100611  ORF g.100611 m.100611 type:complete len:86 (-) comp10357_c0_seq1:6947-7204(-)
MSLEKSVDTVTVSHAVLPTRVFCSNVFLSAWDVHGAGLVAVGYKQRGLLADADDIMKQMEVFLHTRDPRYEAPPTTDDAAAAVES